MISKSPNDRTPAGSSKAPAKPAPQPSAADVGDQSDDPLDETRPIQVILAHRDFPQLAEALHSRIDEIMKRFHTLSVQAMKHLDDMSVKEFENTLLQILTSAAEALASDDPDNLNDLLQHAPVHGFDRFMSEFSLLDLLEENRILRGVVIVSVESALGRRCHVDESASLHATLDIVSQQSVLALVQRQKEHLREAADAERKFLSFFSHDLANHLFALDGNLNLLKRFVDKHADLAPAVLAIDTSRSLIKQTKDGMRRLLKHEQLSKDAIAVDIKTVDLRHTVVSLIDMVAPEIRKKQLHIDIAIPPQATLETDSNLLLLVLQNLIGNAVKYSPKGTIRIEGPAAVQCELEESAAEACWKISVTDEGPGIAEQHRARLFDAFKRGDTLGVEGVGLGLAIAALAAKALGGKIDISTKLGHGSTFDLIIPKTARSQGDRPEQQPVIE